MLWIFLTSWGIIGFSSRTLLHRISQAVSSLVTHRVPSCVWNMITVPNWGDRLLGFDTVWAFMLTPTFRKKKRVASALKDLLLSRPIIQHVSGLRRLSPCEMRLSVMWQDFVNISENSAASFFKEHFEQCCLKTQQYSESSPFVSHTSKRASERFDANLNRVTVLFSYVPFLCSKRLWPCSCLFTRIWISFLWSNYTATELLLPFTSFWEYTMTLMT